MQSLCVFSPPEPIVSNPYARPDGCGVLSTTRIADAKSWERSSNRAARLYAIAPFWMRDKQCE
jgi:hypothetical protein